MAAELKFRTCNLCEAMCGLVMTVDEGRITDVRADREDVFSRGHICPKGPAMREVYEDPDRLRRPRRRTRGGAWQEIGWDEALVEAAERLDEVRTRHGRDALGIYVGNPTVHNHGASMLVPGFIKALGTRNRFDANSQDANPKLFAAMMVYGDQLSITVPDVDRTDYFLMLGANPAASNGSVMTLGDVRGRLRGIRERGGRIVLVDPRRTETADWCDEHHFVRPGGDAALLAAILHVVFARGVVAPSGANGFDELRAAVEPFSPERVAMSVGIDAATIRRIATDFMSAKRAVAYGRVGVCQNPFGATASWLVEALNIVTGNFDREGGAMFPGPAVDTARLGRKLAASSYARWRSRVRGLPEFGGQLPGAVMAEEMETPGPGQIRGFVTIAGNPVLSVPNGERIARALAELEFMVSVDYYLNETTRHAHLILPPRHALERGHYDIVFHALAVRNTAKWSEPVVAPSPDGRDDWEILYELGMRLGGVRLGFGKPIDRAARWAWLRGWRLSPDRMIDLTLRVGPYRGLSLKKLRAAPHGVDLGPLTPARKSRVRTPDGNVRLAPELLVADLKRLAVWVDETRDGGLVLIGRRHVRTNNSWMHNCKSLVKGRDRATLMMHPTEAERRGLVAGQRVRVTTRVGTIEAPLECTEDIMPGVVSLPHGYGHAAAAEHMRTAGATPGPNINAVTDDLLLEPLTGTAVLGGVPVVVESVAHAAAPGPTAEASLT
jgi:anaerobic selenocysteine-containing dehydrogenase